MEKTDQIRYLVNKVHLAGYLAELDRSKIKEGVTKSTNIPYVSFRGAVQCGETPDYTIKFKVFAKSKKNDGTESKSYAEIKDWLAKAVPLTEDKEHPTMVDMIGGITDNPFMTREEELVEGVDFSINYIGEYKNQFAAEIDVEGFIHGYRDEQEKGSDKFTGRRMMRLISIDRYHATLDLKNIVIPEELVQPMEFNHYQKGKTALFFLNLIPNETREEKHDGIGVQRTQGTSHLEWVLTGADPVYSENSNKSLNPKLVKAAMMERVNKLNEIKENGYQGSSDTAMATNRHGFGGMAHSASVSASTSSTEQDFPEDTTPFVEIDEDADFPF